MNCPTCKNPIMNPSPNCEWCGSVISNNGNYDEEIIFFTAKWCGPCKTMLPIINKLKLRYPNLKIVDVDIQKNEANHYDVKNIPFLIKHKNGIIVNKLSGSFPEMIIEKFILG